MTNLFDRRFRKLHIPSRFMPIVEDLVYNRITATKHINGYPGHMPIYA